LVLIKYIHKKKRMEKIKEFFKTLKTTYLLKKKLESQYLDTYKKKRNNLNIRIV